MNWDDRPNKVRILPIYRSAQYRCRYPQKLRAERCLLEWFSLEGQEIGILFGADMQLHQRAGRVGQGRPKDARVAGRLDRRGRRGATLRDDPRLSQADVGSPAGLGG